MTNLIYKMPESLTGVQTLAAGDYKRKEGKLSALFSFHFVNFLPSFIDSKQDKLRIPPIQPSSLLFWPG